MGNVTRFIVILSGVRNERSRKIQCLLFSYTLEEIFTSWIFRLRSFLTPLRMTMKRMTFPIA